MADSPLQNPSALGTGLEGRRTWQLRWRVAAALAMLSSWQVAGAQAARYCDEWSAILTVVEGTVEVQRYDGRPQWNEARSGDRVCAGDTIRAHAASRAAVTLADGTTVRLAEHTTLALPEPESGAGSLINLLRGLIHVISRDPRSLRFSTPYANAGLEGTEFDIRVNESERQTEIAVLEGQVSVTTPQAAIKVGSGHLAIAREGQPPTALPLPAPIELMRWASYYPSIIADELPATDQLPRASEQLDGEFFARRAAARLATAQLDGAEADLETALRIEPGNATALAVQTMIALGRADLATAQQRAASATQSEPLSVVALIALSYVEQSADELLLAEQTVRKALTIESDNAIAATRLAELLLARGDALASIEHATRAQTLAPTYSAPLVVLGFAHLSGRNAKAAQIAFERAGALEPAAPLPRLGLALTATQRGDIVEGRRQLELAVANDPANALTRSYMAKVYDAQYRGDLTASQLELAKQFDPLDPTPWLYSALQNLRSNRPVEALHDLRSAAARNGDRAVFRSRLLLDEDLATRSAALGRVHTELGFGRLALVDAWQAVADSPGSDAGHRLLADVYAVEPRHEIARVSELLVAQLLQPINLTPVKPQLAQPGSFLAQRAGPSPLGFDEFTSLVASDGPKLRASAVGGDQGTSGTDVAVAGLNDRISYSAGHYRFATDGFRANNDFEQHISNALVQFQPSYDTSLQAELRSVRSEYGDLAIVFDRSLYSPVRRTAEDSDSLRLGAKRRLSSSDVLLGSVIYQDAALGLSEGAAAAIDIDRRSYSVDLQHLRTMHGARIQTGIIHARQDDQTLSQFAFPGSPDPLVSTGDTEQRQLGLYSYAHLSPLPTLTVTIGASFDRIEDELVDEDAFNPKLGIIWRPTTHTTIRAAAFRTLFGSLTTSAQNPQPRLEPVQLAGFTQLLFGGTADRADVQGLAIDHELTETVFLGWEATLRDTDRPVLNLTGQGSPVVQVALTERSQQGYVYWTPSDRLSVSAKYEKGRYGSAPVQLFGYSSMDIERLPIEVRYFTPVGLTLGLRASGVHQTGVFQTPAPSPFEPGGLAPAQDRFWLLDASIGYRLPNRRGVLSLNADNLLDEAFQFQDVDPTNPSLFPERLVSLRFTLAFD